MLIHCKNTAIHYKINNIRSARDGRPVRLPGPPPKSAQMRPQAQIHAAHPAHPLRPPCAHPLQAPSSFSKKLEPELLLLAGAPNRCVNAAIHCKINDICIAWVLIHKKTTLFIVISMIYGLHGY